MADFANDLAGVINTVADKVKEYGGYAKLHALIKAEEAKKQELYHRLGKKYYELYKDAPASDLSDIVKKLVAADEKIAGFKEELKSAQEAGYTDVSEDADEVFDDSEDFEDEVAESAEEVAEEITEEE